MLDFAINVQGHYPFYGTSTQYAKDSGAYPGNYNTWANVSRLLMYPFELAGRYMPKSTGFFNCLDCRPSMQTCMTPVCMRMVGYILMQPNRT